MEEEFYFDDEVSKAALAHQRQHPHEDFDNFDDDQDDKDHHGEVHGKLVGHEPRGSKKFIVHKAPFYADIAGFHPPPGIILNPRDNIFTPGLVPGGVAGVTPKLLKFIRTYVNPLAKKKSKPKLHEPWLKEDFSAKKV